jgi:uncharacterized protein
MKRPNAAGIPKQVDAAKAISAGQRFVGTLPLAHLPRLGAQLADNSGALDVDLAAAREAAGAAWLSGRIGGTLSLTCQRGLHPFSWECAIEPRLRLVSSEAEEQRVLKDCEPYLIQDDVLPLRDLIEDEVLLALPIVPRCDDPDCQPLEMTGVPDGATNRPPDPRIRAL